MFIIILNYKKLLYEVDNNLDLHISYLKSQYEKGNFIASGRKVPRTGGVILSMLKSKKIIEDAIKEDPFYKANIADYQIIEFTPTMTADGFNNLS